MLMPIITALQEVKAGDLLEASLPNIARSHLYKNKNQKTPQKAKRDGT